MIGGSLVILSVKDRCLADNWIEELSCFDLSSLPVDE